MTIVITVRWDALFADLEAAAEAQNRLAFEADLADQVRAERAAITLTDRLRAQTGSRLACHLVDGDWIEGVLVDAGADWLLLRSGPGGRRQCLVPVLAIGSLTGLSRGAAAPGVVARRLRLSVVLRALATARATVAMRLRSGQTLVGTIDRVGADHVDLALHPADEPRRQDAVLGVRAVPLAAMLLIRSERDGM